MSDFLDEVLGYGARALDLVVFLQLGVWPVINHGFRNYSLQVSRLASIFDEWCTYDEYWGLTHGNLYFGVILVWTIWIILRSLWALVSKATKSKVD